MGSFTVTASTRDHAQVLSLQVVATSPGEYALGGGYPSSSVGLNIDCQPHPGTCPAWSAPFADQPTNGSITLSSLTPTGAAGFFSATLRPNTATPASGITVVNGAFDVTF
jgi:hypothetical protein